MDYFGSKMFFGGVGDEAIVTVDDFPSLTCQVLTYLYNDPEKQTNKEALNTRKQQQRQIRWRPQIVFEEERASKLDISMPHWKDQNVANCYLERLRTVHISMSFTVYRRT